MFLAKSNRFSTKEVDMVTADTSIPGPGAYDKVLPKIIHHTFNKGSKARFGSGMERYNPSMINRKEDWKIGPG